MHGLELQLVAAAVQLLQTLGKPGGPKRGGVCCVYEDWLQAQGAGYPTWDEGAVLCWESPHPPQVLPH